MLDAFPAVKLGTRAVDEVRQRVQQEIHRHRGRKNDPLYGIRTILRCGAENLTDRQRTRLEKTIGPPRARSRGLTVRALGLERGYLVLHLVSFDRHMRSDELADRVNRPPSSRHA